MIGPGWRLALRIGRRDALRARGRSILVLVMIALPVLGVTAAVVAQRTSDVTVAEGLDRTIGAAQARVDVDTGYRYAVAQTFDNLASTSTGEELTGPAPSRTSLAAMLDAPVTEIVETSLAVQSDDGVATAEGLEADLGDPLTAGLVDLTSGRLPLDASEVVVNQAMLDQGPAVGERLLTRDATDGPRIVGVAESASLRTFPFAAGPVGSLPVADDLTVRSYLVGGAPVDWGQVRELNALGAGVTSRAVVLDPPPSSELAPEARGIVSSGFDETTGTVLALVVTMALLEVVLLAGPAFAVGARRLQRSLALMAAAGATPRQARRVVLAGAVVLGSLAAVLGVVAGVALGAVVLVVLQRFSDTWFGPFEVPVLPVLAVAAFGLLSALLAAVVPARLASRQDVAAVLAGRRGDAPPSYRSPLLGAVLLGGGVLLAVVGATSGSGEVLIALAALVCVLGMVLLVPLVVSSVARLAGRMPLSLRYATRDAARHRTRTAPAVAAVAATVAGVVALLVANTSDAAENEATYRPALAAGAGLVTLNGGDGIDTDLAAAAAVVRREAPTATLVPVRGIAYPADAGVYRYTSVVLPGATTDPDAALPLTTWTSGAYGADLLVSDDGLPPGIPGLTQADVAAARAALAGGGVVAFSNAEPGTAPTSREVVLHTTSSDRDGNELPPVDRQVTATVLHVAAPPVSAVVSSGVAASLGGQPVDEVGLAVTGAGVTPEQEEAVTEALDLVSVTTTDGFTFPAFRFYVERGYQADDETLVLQLILLGLGGVLMLGGTLTATFLALADARPDLATLAAVGASPRRRRGVAAGYALVVGLVGAVLGALVGFVPGLAVAVPLTSSSGDTVTISGSGSGSGSVSGSADGVGTGPYLDVPWLMILGLVVLLPLLTASIVAATTRSRLPMVTRVE